jgi:tripartite-type tricarboxylate transporter receptor subunit TctC
MAAGRELAQRNPHSRSGHRRQQSRRARVIADTIGQRLKQRVIVENQPGAGGTIGALAVARSKPNGSTLLFTNNSHLVSPHIYANAGYDPIRDFAPVAQA